jgi:hypothetical protein
MFYVNQSLAGQTINKITGSVLMCIVSCIHTLNVNTE